MTVVRINEFQSTTEKAEELFDFLTSLIPYISSCEGCSSCEVLKKHEYLGHFVVIEKWQSVQAHQASVAGFPKEEMAAAMHLFSVAPTGFYYDY